METPDFDDVAADTLMQRVVLNGEDAKATVKDISGKIEAIMKG